MRWFINRSYMFEKNMKLVNHISLLCIIMSIYLFCLVFRNDLPISNNNSSFYQLKLILQYYLKTCLSYKMNYWRIQIFFDPNDKRFLLLSWINTFSFSTIVRSCKFAVYYQKPDLIGYFAMKFFMTFCFSSQTVMIW